MSPKEKAIQLVDDFMDFSDEQEYNTPRYMTKEMAIHCALKTVDEIQKLPNIQYNSRRYDESQYDYWQEVKQEINKL